MGILDRIKDTFTSAEFDVKGNMKVKTLQKYFKESFGADLRVYYGKRFANKDHTIAKVRDKNSPGTGKEFKIRATWKVKKLEKIFIDSFGIKVQVALPGNTELADNNLTLGEVSRSDQ